MSRQPAGPSRVARRTILVAGGSCDGPRRRRVLLDLLGLDLAFSEHHDTRQVADKMLGYILYRSLEGDIVRFEAERSSRRVLSEVLEGAAPANAQILGVVFGPRPDSHLRVIAA